MFHIFLLQKIYPIFYISYSSVRRLTGLVLLVLVLVLLVVPVPMLRFEKNTDASLGKYAYLPGSIVLIWLDFVIVAEKWKGTLTATIAIR